VKLREAELTPSMLDRLDLQPITELEDGEYGEAIDCHHDNTHVVHCAIQAVKSAAEQRLPKGTVFEIRGKDKPKAGRYDFGRSFRTRAEAAERWGVAWYVNNREDEAEQFQQRPLLELNMDYRMASENIRDGYKLIGRFRT